jgi:hypothetical protein
MKAIMKFKIWNKHSVKQTSLKIYKMLLLTIALHTMMMHQSEI